MHHESPANMPLMLKRLTGEEDVRMIGTEGVLAGGLDKLVNELHGDQFEVSLCVFLHRRTSLTQILSRRG